MEDQERQSKRAAKRTTLGLKTMQCNIKKSGLKNGFKNVFPQKIKIFEGSNIRPLQASEGLSSPLAVSSN